MANRYWCTRCDCQMLHSTHDGLCSMCRRSILLAGAGSTATTAACTRESIFEMIQRMKALVASLPPPMDLHVTPQLYAMMKKSWKAEVGMSIACVIPDLPIYSPHQYEWRSRPPLPKGPPHADRPER